MNKDGLSIRFLRDYYPSAAPMSPHGVNLDTAFALALSDERDIPFAQKLADAMAFIKSRIH